jgi:mRNA interferase HigB
VHVISRKTLKDFWEKHGDAEDPLKTWYHEAKRAKWRNWIDIKSQYGNASPIKGSRVVFNIGGNKFRLVVLIKYKIERVYVRFIGTHKEYDKINVEKI